MSNSVLIEFEKGKWVPLTIGEMRPSYMRYPMRCNGRIWGSENNRCTVPMTAKTRTEDGSYSHFSEKYIKEHPHADGCEFNRRSSFISSSRYDFRAAGEKKEDYLAKLISMRVSVKKPRSRGGGIIDIEDPEKHNFNELDETNKEIKRIKRKPNSIKNLAKLLTYLDVNNTYMDKPVKDWIVNRHTLAYHLGKEILEGRMIVIAKLCSYMKLGVPVHKNEWILADCTFKGNYKDTESNLFYHLKCNDDVIFELKKFSRRDDRENYYVIICSAWKKSTDTPNLLKSEVLTKKMIAFVRHEEINRRD